MISITIEGKSLGSKRRLFEDFSVPIEPLEPIEGGVTLRDLIQATVRQQVKDFHKRQENRKFIRVLTTQDIETGVERGKIDSGGAETEPQSVDTDHAIATAIEAFEDGLYLVSLDDQQVTDLDSRIFLANDSRVTFIRLTMLAGG